MFLKRLTSCLRATFGTTWTWRVRRCAKKCMTYWWGTMLKTMTPCSVSTTPCLSLSGLFCRLGKNLSGWLVCAEAKRRSSLEWLQAFQCTWESTGRMSRWQRSTFCASTRIWEPKGWHLCWSKKSQGESICTTFGKPYTQRASLFQPLSREPPTGTDQLTSKSSLMCVLSTNLKELPFLASSSWTSYLRRHLSVGCVRWSKRMCLLSTNC